MTDDTEQKSGSFVDRMKESPRTVSALIIILIVAAAIYAFSGDNSQQPTEPTTTPEETTAPAASDAAVEGTTDNKDTTATKTPVETPKAVTKEDLVKTSQELPQATKTNDSYVEVAQKGDGLTHIARRAATRWLSENEAGYTVTNEHRIYIEDYVRKHMEKVPTKVGAEKTISFTLIADAVKAAGELNAKQLNNLSQYTHALK